MSKGKGKRVEGEALERVNNMDVLAGSIDVLLDNFLEGVDEVQDRLGLDRADTLAVLGNFSKKLRRWMEAHHAMLDAGRRPERTDPTDAALLGAVMRQPGSGVGGFASTVVHAWGPASRLPISPGVEVPPTREELVEELVVLRRSNRLRGERANRERRRREDAEAQLVWCGCRVRADVAKHACNVGNGVQRMGGATGDAS